jgi:hypothetical protein
MINLEAWCPENLKKIKGTPYEKFLKDINKREKEIES